MDPGLITSGKNKRATVGDKLFPLMGLSIVFNFETQYDHSKHDNFQDVDWKRLDTIFVRMSQLYRLV